MRDFDWRSAPLGAGQRRRDGMDAILEMLQEEEGEMPLRALGEPLLSAPPPANKVPVPVAGNKKIKVKDYRKNILELMKQNEGKDSTGVNFLDSSQHENEVATDEFDLG